jgi:hypothetical protein
MIMKNIMPVELAKDANKWLYVQNIHQ